MRIASPDRVDCFPRRTAAGIQRRPSVLATLDRLEPETALTPSTVEQATLTEGYLSVAARGGRVPCTFLDGGDTRGRYVVGMRRFPAG